MQHNDPLIRRQVTKCRPQSGSRSCTISSRPSWAGATIICGSLTSTDEYGLAMDEDWGGTPRSLGSHVRLRDVLKPGRTVIDYTYDFGDCWEHRLTAVSRGSHILATSAAKETDRPKTAAAYRASTNGLPHLETPNTKAMLKLKNGRMNTTRMRSMSCRSNMLSAASPIGGTLAECASPRTHNRDVRTATG